LRAQVAFHKALPFPKRLPQVSLSLACGSLSLAGNLRQTSSVFVQREKPCFKPASRVWFEMDETVWGTDAFNGAGPT
jgi:hypothetical protein